MSKMRLGVLELAMMVVTPAEVASRAAVSLVDIPPVPNEEPAEETSTWSELMSSTTSTGLASGKVRGFLS